MDVRVQILDPVTHRAVGIIWTSDADERYVASIVPPGFAAKIDCLAAHYCLLPQPE